MGKTCHLCCLCFKLMIYKRSRVYYSKSNYVHQANKKKLVSGLAIQVIPPKVYTKHHHTATESLYRLRGAKSSWTPSLAGVSYQFGFNCFFICLQCKISGSSVFSIFPHKVSHHKVRKVMDSRF